VCKNVLTISLDDEDGKIVNALHVQGSNLIQSGKIKKDDIIYQIDGNYINKDGNLIINKRTKLPIETYFAESKGFNNKKVNLTLYREDSKSKEYKRKELQVEMFNVVQNKIIPTSFSNDYFQINGLLFCEISENIIRCYANNGFILGGNIIDAFKKKRYTQSKKRIVGLVNMDKNILGRKCYKTFQKLGIPLHKNGKQYFLPIVKSVNTRIVKNLDGMAQATPLSDRRMLTIVCSLYPGKDIHIKIKNSNITLSIVDAI
jgi:hypothetical protein